MERVEDILDELEMDEEDHQLQMTVEEALNMQVAEEEALDAVEKVAHVAQASLRRLQQVVKEKDELIVVLQEAVGSARQIAVDQHENDQHELELLHQLLLDQEDRSIQAITDALQTVIKQQPLSWNSLAGQVARLFDQYLHEISIKHEQDTEDLQRSLATLHNRCQELEETLDCEKRNMKTYLNAQLDEKVAVCSNTRSQLTKSEEQVEDLKRQLNEKDDQLRVYDNTVQELERLLEEEKVRETNLSSEHERMCAETRRSLGQVSSVGQQLQKLKDQTHKFQKQEDEYEYQLRDLREKVTSQKALIHKLSVQLATLRKKSKVVKTPPVDKEAERGYMARKQTQYLQDCIQNLSAQVLLLKNELREARKEKDDSSIRYSHDVTLTDETRICSSRSMADNSLSFVQPETMKKMEDYEKLTRRIEILQRNLKATKQELRKKDNEMSISGAAIEQLRQELRKSKETVEQLREKKRKKMESGKKKPTDCVRLKGLLENIEMLEMENAVLKHEDIVQKNRRIANLERELKNAQGLDILTEGKQQACSKAMKISDESTAQKVKKELEDIIANKESLILELKFEADQATWKLAQVEKRFDILFGALECKKFELSAPVADTLLENIFSSDTGELSVPALTLLREKVLQQRGFLRSGSRERELQDLVDALMKVVEKLNSENESLKQSCEDTVKHMQKNRKLRKVMQNQTEKVGGNSEDTLETGIVSDLKAKMQDLFEANAGLVRALRESEDMYSALRQKMYEQQMIERRAASGLTTRTGKRCSSSEENPTSYVPDQEWRLKSQAERIENLEKQLVGRDQEVALLNSQLEMKDDELDLLHGKLWLQETAEEPIESVYQQKVDMWSAQEANTKYCEVKLCPSEDYIDTEFIEENEWESLKEENRRLKAVAATTEIEPQVFEDVMNLKDQLESMTKVCERYEELLRIYSKQIGVPFESFRRKKRT